MIFNCFCGLYRVTIGVFQFILSALFRAPKPSSEETRQTIASHGDPRAVSDSALDPFNSASHGDTQTVFCSALEPHPFDPACCPHLVDRMVDYLRLDGAWPTIHTLRAVSHRYRDHAEAAPAAEVVLLSSRRPSPGLRFFAKHVNPDLGPTHHRARIPGLKQLGPYRHPEEVPTNVRRILKHVRTAHIRFWWWAARSDRLLVPEDHHTSRAEYILCPHLPKLTKVGVAHEFRNNEYVWPTVVPFSPRSLLLTRSTAETTWYPLPSLVGLEELRMEVCYQGNLTLPSKTAHSTFSHLQRVELVVRETLGWEYNLAWNVEQIIWLAFDFKFLLSYPGRCWFGLRSISDLSEMHDADGHLKPASVETIRRAITSAFGSTDEASSAAAKVHFLRKD